MQITIDGIGTWTFMSFMGIVVVEAWKNSCTKDNVHWRIVRISYNRNQSLRDLRTKMWFVLTGSQFLANTVISQVLLGTPSMNSGLVRPYLFDG